MSVQPCTISRLDVGVYTIPTDAPEADGTYDWQATTLVLVEAFSENHIGVGYTYADVATGLLIKEMLVGIVTGGKAMDVAGSSIAMAHSVRNLGRPGIVSMAMAAVDSALWDLKARLLDIPLVSLIGAVRECVPIYGSGGFTSYSKHQLQDQLGSWVAQGITRVKMKIGSRPDADFERVRHAREAIGPDTELFVDANGAYDRKQALGFAEKFADLGVRWFEEPVPAEDLEGLHLLRDRAPAGMDIAAGEYGYSLPYFTRMLEAKAVDVLQADASRCAGITGFLGVSAICEARLMPLSAHCAPSLHVHPCCATGPLRHLEYFHDHSRIEHMLFDGVLSPKQGALYPDLSRPGNGLAFKHADAKRYAA